MPHQCTDCGRTFADGSKEMLSGCPNCGGNKFQFLPAGADVDGSAAEPPDSADEPPEPPEPTGESSVSRTVGNAAAAVRDFVGASGGSPGPSSPPTSGPGGSSDTPSPEPTPPTADPSGADESASALARDEDAAQADARSEVVGPDDLPPIPERDGVARSGSDEADAVGSSSPDSAAADTGADSSTALEATVAEGESATDDAAPKSTTDSDAAETGEVTDQPDLAQLREELNDQFESIRVVAPGQYELNLMELYDRDEYIIALQEDGRYTIQVPETWRD
jgi:predicted  nucleic acid-binding Zn-ribbon protein